MGCGAAADSDGTSAPAFPTQKTRCSGVADLNFRANVQRAPAERQIDGDQRDHCAAVLLAVSSSVTCVRIVEDMRACV